ncbi:MAG: HNH endonuclease signature motif containing protein [Bdellovibrionota bacterium]
MNLKNVSNDNLLQNIKKLSLEERKITTEILHHLKEIENRKLHLEIGYSSLFEYTVKELSYGEDAAYRRINAMRLLKSVPEVENKILKGSLSLAGAAKIQRFLNAQNKVQSPVPTQNKSQHNSSPKIKTKEEKLTFVESMENKSLFEIEKAMVKLNPESIPQEKIRQINEEKIELKLVIDEDLKNQLDRLKNFLSHKNPNMSYNELLKYLTQLGLQKLDPENKIKNQKAESKNQRTDSCQTRVVASKKSRSIPAIVKREVYVRDKGCCTFTDPKSKRKCTSQHLLQYDHKYPLSLGGETSVQNLRLLCFQHHKLITGGARKAGLPSAVNQNSDEI